MSTVISVKSFIENLKQASGCEALDLLEKLQMNAITIDLENEEQQARIKELECRIEKVKSLIHSEDFITHDFAAKLIAALGQSE